MVRDCDTHHHKLTVRHTHVKPVVRPATKVTTLIPFPILLLNRTNWITCSTLPLYVSVFPGLFIFRLRTGSMLPKFFAILSAVTPEGHYAAQMFRNIRTAVLSAITIRRNTYAAHTFQNLGTFPHSPCITVRTGSMLPKIVRTWARLPTLCVYVT